MILSKNVALLVASTTLCVSVACGSSTSSTDKGGKGGGAGSADSAGGARTGKAGQSGASAGAVNDGEAGAGGVSDVAGAAGATAGTAGNDEGGAGGASAGAGGTENGGAAGTAEGGAAGNDEDLTLGDVNAVVTCDNAYGFGWGSVSELHNYRSAPPAFTAGDIFDCGNGPEGYLVPSAEAPPSAYLYAAAWGDHAVTQGLIGQFQRVAGAPVHTGDAGWQVCATGIDFDTSVPAQQTGPSLEQIEAEIVRCNAGTGDRTTSSAGWVDASGAVTPNAIGKLAVGQDNSQSGQFPLVCPSGGASPGIDAAARWMWYSSTGTGDAFLFTTLDASRPFLIFRLAAGSLPASH